MKYIAILAALAAFNAGAITATKEYVDAKDSAISTNLTNLVATTAQGLRSEVSSTYATKSTTYTKSAVDSLLAGKQASLTAGNNVIITNGTISAVDTVYNDTAIRGRVSSLESGVAGWNAKVDAIQLAPYATREWVSSLGYLTLLDLSPYALKEWVNSQSFLTASSLTPYATTAWVNGLGYATRTWVNDKGYATTSWVNSQVYATESWVTGRCYVVRSDLNGYATTSSLSNKLDKSWVTSPDRRSSTGEAADSRATYQYLNGKLNRDEVIAPTIGYDGYAADADAVAQALALKADKTDVKAIASGENVTITTNGNSLVISASGGGSSPSPWTTSGAIEWNSDGTAITVSVAASGTLSANLTGWTDGQAQTARITIASGASIATNVKFVGYGYWPTDEEFLAVCVRVGSSIFVNVITAIN